MTHMRVPNDTRLATECGRDLDLILAGHDHHYAVRPRASESRASEGGRNRERGAIWVTIVRVTYYVRQALPRHCKRQKPTVTGDAVLR